MVKENVEQEIREENIGNDPDVIFVLMQPDLVVQRVKGKYAEIAKRVKAH